MCLGECVPLRMGPGEVEAEAGEVLHRLHTLDRIDCRLQAIATRHTRVLRLCVTGDTHARLPVLTWQATSHTDTHSCCKHKR